MHNPVIILITATQTDLHHLERPLSLQSISPKYDTAEIKKKY